MPFLPVILLSLVLAVPTSPAVKDSVALHTLLDQFLAGASRNDATMHDRFWADDLIYTGSSGRRIGKADIMKDVRSSVPPTPGTPEPVFTAEEVRIHVYGDAALVAFRLVSTTTAAESTSVAHYLNSGMFLKRGGVWKAVGWQATKQP